MGNEADFFTLKLNGEGATRRSAIGANRLSTVRDTSQAWQGLALTLENDNAFGVRYYSLLRVASHTIRMETSAGFTPEIRPACPRLRGLIRFSFSCASNRKPAIVV